MKWSTTVSLAVAPLAAMAANNNKMRRTYPVSVNPRAEAASQLDGRSIAIINGMKGHGLSAGALDQVVIIWVNPGNNAPTTSINKPAHPGAGQGEATPAPGQGEATPAPGQGEAPPAEIATTTAPSESETTTAPAAGASHTVKVGGPSGLVFDPDQLNIPVGDSVVFEFLSQNHTVTQSPFDTPCKALEGGMDSGFLPNPNNTVNPPPQVAMQVMATTPLWFYCRQMGHCGKGMVFSINPTANKTQALFQSMAIAQNGTGEATPITGGTGNPGAALPPPPPANAEEPQESTTSEPALEEPTSAAPAEEPGATETPSSPAAGGEGEGSTGGEGEGSAGATTGTGTVGPDGSCTCVVACNAGGFPAAAQGAGAFGGFAGTLPTKMAAMR